MVVHGAPRQEGVARPPRGVPGCARREAPEVELLQERPQLLVLRALAVQGVVHEGAPVEGLVGHGAAQLQHDAVQQAAVGVLQ